MRHLFTEMITTETKDNWYISNGYARIENDLLLYDFGEKSCLSPVYKGSAGWARDTSRVASSVSQRLQPLQALDINVALQKMGGEARGIQLKGPIQFTSASGTISVKLEGASDLAAKGVDLGWGADVLLGKGPVYAQVVH